MSIILRFIVDKSKKFEIFLWIFMVRNVVLKLIESIYKNGHVVICNNIFANVGLFKELANYKINPSSSTRSN